MEKVAKLAAERNISLCGWEDGFADGHHDPINSTDLDTSTNYAIPWNSIWEWGGGSQAYLLANAGYKVIFYFIQNFLCHVLRYRLFNPRVNIVE